MEPIISPIWFYFLGTIPEIKNVLMVSGLIVPAVVLMRFLFCLADNEIEIYEKSEKKTSIKKKSKKLIIASLVIILVSTLLPSKETMYSMIISANITPNNVDAVGNSIENIVDYVIEAVDKLNDDEDK